MIGFKVLFKSSDQLFSYASPMPIEYTPRKWTYPYSWCGPLAVFPSLEFLRWYSGYETAVWVCEYDPVEGHELFVSEPTGQGRHSIGYYKFPVGTALASRVRLLREYRERKIGG